MVISTKGGNMKFFKMIKIKSINDLKSLMVNEDKNISLYDKTTLQQLMVLKYLLQDGDSPASNGNIWLMKNTETEKYEGFYFEYGANNYEPICFEFFWDGDEDFAEYLMAHPDHGTI